MPLVLFPAETIQKTVKDFFFVVLVRTDKARELVLLVAGKPCASAEERDDLLMRIQSTKKPGAAIRADAVWNIGECFFGLGVAVLRWRGVCRYS